MRIYWHPEWVILCDSCGEKIWPGDGTTITTQDHECKIVQQSFHSRAKGDCLDKELEDSEHMTFTEYLM